MRITHYRIGMVCILLPLVWLSWSACKRTLKSNETLGDSKLVTAPEEFTGIVGAVAPMVHYPFAPFSSVVGPTYKLKFGNSTGGNNNSERFYFNNQLSHEVTWFINFKGTSGAEKQYTGTGNSIDSLHVMWNGSADGSRFFIDGDVVTYTISFLGSTINYTGILNIKTSMGAVNYGVTRKLLSNGNILRYTYIDGMTDGYPYGGSGIRTSYTDAGDGNGAGQFFVSTALQVDGHFSYYMKATDNNANTYCGGASGESLTEMYGATSQTDASEVYINAYIYGYGRANTTLTFQCFEDDSWNLSSPAPTVRPAAASNDMWYGMVQVDWLGWKLVSIPYSSLKSANNPNSGGGGNRIREPHKLAGFGIELDSYPNGGSTVELSLDAVYLTTNGPFQP